MRSNLFTRFNAILGSLLCLVAAVGPWQDGLFIAVPLVNSVLGIVEEFRSKRTLDRLSVLTEPTIRVTRGGLAQQVATRAVQRDDLMDLARGDQVPADGEVERSAGLQLDESLLTGEADPVDKSAGDRLMSGTFVVAGQGLVRATSDNRDSYASQLEVAARRFHIRQSQLQVGINRILRMATWLMVPLGVLLVTSQVLRAHQDLPDAIRGSVAGMVSLVPEGLVLLTTIAFALGALRLARRGVLVQTLSAVEGLARVDVLCIDKTGTLTEPGMGAALVSLDASNSARSVISALAASDPRPNATMRALQLEFPAAKAAKVVSQIPFSSQRGWSGGVLEGLGVWVLGGADVLLPHLARPSGLDERVAEETHSGSRVLVLARGSGADLTEKLPTPLTAVALVLLQERLRPQAGATLDFLQEQGVSVKVLSGDDARTVATVARRAGIRMVAAPIDARSLTNDALGGAVERASVFGRVAPEQKREMVAALQKRGHVVAMTGDGVNDVAALKQADIGIAMGSGSPATRAVAHVVLVASDFGAVPGLLAEGRRVIANVERVARVVVTKTVYAAVLAAVIGAIAVPFPLFPRHFTVVAAWTIGIPGFFLALAPAAARAQPGFLRRVLTFTIPLGLAAGGACVGAYLLASASVLTAAGQARTAAAVGLCVVGLWVLAYLSWPLKRWRLVLVLLMIAGATATAFVPLAQSIFAIQLPPPSVLLMVVGESAAAAVLGSLGWWLARRLFMPPTAAPG